MDLNTLILPFLYFFIGIFTLTIGILWYYILKFRRLSHVLETPSFIEQVINQW